MSADPILILQLQRMGDLILTFPLVLSLQKCHPQHPLWVVAEPQFFTPLMPLSPNVVYFPPNACDALAQKKFFMIINLSGRPEASLCLSKAKAERKIGLAWTDESKQVFGEWSLYRFALTQNNHHNTFHWSDLYKLDALPLKKYSTWRSPRTTGNRKRVALVVGASEASKRPDSSFWATLARKLAHNGYIPILLGGAAEKDMGEHICRMANLPKANLCGKLKLDEVASILRECALCITPDTGPMHLADWMGTQILNLSMGPVHAPETGPLSSQHWILRARMSCVGCWQCMHSAHKCKEKFYAPQIAKFALTLLNEPSKAKEFCPKGLELLRSTRDKYGLYCLASETHAQTCRENVDNFWRTAFLVFADYSDKAELQEQYESLCHSQPAIAKKLVFSLKHLFQICGHGLKEKTTLPENIWHQSPQVTRFFVGHTQMTLQNANWEKKAWLEVMERTELLLTCTGDGQACPLGRTRYIYRK